MKLVLRTFIGFLILSLTTFGVLVFSFGLAVNFYKYENLFIGLVIIVFLLGIIIGSYEIGKAILK